MSESSRSDSESESWLFFFFRLFFDFPPSESASVDPSFFGSPRGLPPKGFPPPLFSPFGYSPFGGMGTGYALGAMSSGGNRQEVYRVENELGRTEGQLGSVEAQLEAEKQKNLDLEKRMEAIEAAIPDAKK